MHQQNKVLFQRTSTGRIALQQTSDANTKTITLGKKPKRVVGVFIPDYAGHYIGSVVYDETVSTTTYQGSGWYPAVPGTATAYSRPSINLGSAYSWDDAGNYKIYYFNVTSTGFTIQFPMTGPNASGKVPGYFYWGAE